MYICQWLGADEVVSVLQWLGVNHVCQRLFNKWSEAVAVSGSWPARLADICALARGGGCIEVITQRPSQTPIKRDKCLAVSLGVCDVAMKSTLLEA
jgi:hypothetical protein